MQPSGKFYFKIVRFNTLQIVYWLATSMFFTFRVNLIDIVTSKQLQQLIYFDTKPEKSFPFGVTFQTAPACFHSTRRTGCKLTNWKRGLAPSKKFLIRKNNRSRRSMVRKKKESEHLWSAIRNREVGQLNHTSEIHGQKKESDNQKSVVKLK